MRQQNLGILGEFVASYKFALLLALADLSVEQGDDSGAEEAFSIGMQAKARDRPNECRRADRQRRPVAAG